MRGILPLSLVLFAVLDVASLVLTNLPDPAWSDSETLAFYADSGHRAKELVAAYAAAGAGALLIVIVASIVAGARREREVGALELSAAISGTAFATLYLAAHAAWVTPVAFLSLGFGDEALVDPTVAKATGGLGDALLLGMAQIPAGIFVICASWALFGVALRRRRLGVFGVVVGALILLTTFFWVGLLLLPLWALVAAIALLASHDSARGPLAGPAA